MELPENERERLYRTTKHVKGEDLKWYHVNGRLRLRADVFVNGQTSETAIIQVIATKRKRRGFSFALMYNRNQLIRRWDNGRHRNPDGTIILGSHKHYWTPTDGDQWAYDVDDINLTNLQTGFFNFLDECNITVLGNYQMIIDF